MINEITELLISFIIENANILSLFNNPVIHTSITAY